MGEGSSVSAHVIKLQGYIQRLEALGVPFPADFRTDMILKSLPPSFPGFVRIICMAWRRHSPNCLLWSRLLRKTYRRPLTLCCWWGIVLNLRNKKSGSKKKGNSKGTWPSRMPRRRGPDLRPMLSASSVRRMVTRRGIAQITWQKRRRLEPQAQVYPIYILLMFT
jgi:hypothetical protein